MATETRCSSVAWSNTSGSGSDNPGSNPGCIILEKCIYSSKYNQFFIFDKPLIAQNLKCTIICEKPYLVVALTDSFYLAFIKREIDIKLETNKSILVEHTSANPIYAEFHLGNLASGIIGTFVLAFYKQKGYNMTSAYYVNDSGQRIRALSVMAMKYPYLDYTELYAKYKEENIDDNELNTLYTTIDLKEQIKLRRSVVDKNMSALLLLLKRVGIIEFTKLYYESNYIMKPNITGININEDGALYYSLPDKQVYLTTKFGFPLYALGDLNLTILEKTKYDIVYTVIGIDQKLHFETLHRIIRASGYNTKNLKTIHIPLLKLNGTKLKKTSKTKTIKIIDLLNNKNPHNKLFINLLKIYTLSRVLDQKEYTIDSTLLTRYKYVFLLLSTDIAARKVNSTNTVITSMQKRYVNLILQIRYGYATYKGFFNELVSLSEKIWSFYLDYLNTSEHSIVDAFLYTEFESIKVYLTTALGFIR